MQSNTSSKDFQILNKLGQGAFGQVFKVKRKIDNQIYAMKKIKLASLNQKERQNALNEVRILASYNGQYIIGYKQCFYDESASTLCIVMEFAGSGDMLKMTQNHIKNRTKFNQSQIWKALVHITQGLRSLHDKKILHRDLKCANVFVTSQGVYKLGDLNVSKVLKKDMAQTQTGTPYYASPEVWQDKPYGAKSDMWSLGCVLYQMAALKPPFTATDLSGLCKKICAGYFNRIPASYSNDLAKVISSLLKINPNERPNTLQLLENQLIHKNFVGKIDVNVKEKQQQDFLLKTLKVQKGNLKSIKDILPSSNYNGQLKTSRSRANSTESKKDSFKQQSKKEQLKKDNVIQNYLEMKRRHEQNQRKRMIEQMKNQKDDISRKRQRVLSACGMRNHTQANDSKNIDSLKKIVDEDKGQNGLMTPQVKKKDCNLPPLSSNRNLAPKPPMPYQNNNIINNMAYKLPPRPNPLVPSRQINSIDSSRNEGNYSKQLINSGRQKSKQNLVRAGHNLMNQDNLVSPRVGQNRQQVNKIVRSNSVNKGIYPNWW